MTLHSSWSFSSVKSLVCVIAATLTPSHLPAGTLDDAPFRIVVPNGEWKIEDSKTQEMGNDVFLVATISKTNSLLKSVIIRTVLKTTSKSELDELCAGIRDSFSDPVVKKISEAETKFLNHKARRFAYEVAQVGQTIYNEAVVFVAGKTGWTIVSLGRADQKDEVRRILTFYRDKKL